MADGSTNTGREAMWDVLLAGNLSLRLFSNNFSPSGTSVLGDFTEATFTGYAAITLTGGAWVTTAGGPATAVFAQQAFSIGTSAQTIYGYYIVHVASGTVWRYGRFPSALSATANAIKVTPTIGLT